MLDEVDITSSRGMYWLCSVSTDMAVTPVQCLKSMDVQDLWTACAPKHVSWTVTLVTTGSKLALSK